MTAADRQRRDAKYAPREIPSAVEPSDWWVRHAGNLPPGRALDLACGLGHAAIWLALRGWDVTAVDISPVGLDLVRRFADVNSVAVNFVVADLDQFDLGQDAFDLITVFRFLDRTTLPKRIVPPLRPGGWLLYETFLSDGQIHDSGRPMNPAFVLSTYELPRLFSGLTTVEYVESQVPERLAMFSGINT